MVKKESELSFLCKTVTGRDWHAFFSISSEVVFSFFFFPI